MSFPHYLLGTLLARCGARKRHGSSSRFTWSANRRMGKARACSWPAWVSSGCRNGHRMLCLRRLTPDVRRGGT